jgi:hypothetical protein
MITIIFAAALAVSSCQIHVKTTVRSYGIDHVTTTCASTFNYNSGQLSVSVPGDGIFKSGFEK